MPRNRKISKLMKKLTKCQLELSEKKVKATMLKLH